MKFYLKKSVESKDKLKNWWVKMLSIFAIFCAFIPRIALAAGGSKLLNADPLTTLQETISGPVLSAISVIMVVVTAVMMGFGEWGDGFKRLIQIVFWISIAAGASSLIGNIMG